MLAGTLEIQLLANLARLQSDMDKAQRTVGAAMKNINSAVELTKRALGGLGAGFSLVQVTKALIQTSDQFTKLTAQIKNATRSQQEYNVAFSNITRIAKTAQSEIESVSKLYARLTLSLRDANKNQKEIATISETVALALKVNGATVAESASAMLQLSQAFGSGVLRGEEFRAVMESAPNLMRRLAESIGVPVGQLKALAEQGKLTIDELSKAFGDSKYLSMLREQAEHVRNIGGAWQVFKNELILSIGEIDKAAGSSRFLSALLGGAGMAVKEATGRGGNSTIPAVNPEDVLVGGLRRGLLFGGLSNVVIGDTPEVVKKREAAFAELTKTLKIAGAEIERLNNLEKQANDLLAAGTIEAEQHAIAIAAINEERAKLADKANKEHEWRKKIAQEDDEYRAKQIEQAQEQIDRERKFLEVQQSAIDSMSRTVAGWNDLTEVQRTSWEIQTGRFKDFDEQTKVELLRLAEIIDARKEQEKTEKRIAELQDQANKNFKAAQEESARLAKEARDEQLKVWESIERTAHDTFISIFDSGKSAFDRLRDALKNGLLDLLYQMTLKKWIIHIGAAVSGAGTAGMASAAGLMPGEWQAAMGGSGSFGLGSIKSIFDVVTKGFDAANNLFLQGINDFGAYLADFGGVVGDFGGFIGQYSTQIATALPFAPAILSFLTGDIKGGLSSGIGAGIGTAIGGPVGGAIGAALGSLVGGLFGGDEPELYGAQSRSTFQGGSLSLSKQNDYGKSLGAQALKSIKSVTDGFVNTLGTFLNAFGLDPKISASAVFRKRTTVRGGFWGSIDGQDLSLSKKYGDDADMQASFDDFVKQVMGPMMVKAIQKSDLEAGIKMLFKGLTNRNQVVAMMNASMGLNSSEEQLAERFGLSVDQAGRVAKATGLAKGALIEFVNTLSSSALAFKTVGETIIEFRDGLTESFSSKGGGNSLPSTLQAFDDILKGIDKTTQAGIKQFADLFQLREQFSQYVQSIDSLKGGVKGAIFSMSSPAEQQAMLQADLAELFGSLNMTVPGSVQELIELGKSIDYTTEEGLNLAAVFPTLVEAFQKAKDATDGLIDSLNELNPDRYRTLFEFTRAQAYVNNGISLDRLPSYDVGTPFVPQTGPAMIHYGERILTASENRAFTEGNAALAAEIRMLNSKIDNVSRELQSIAISASDTYRSVDRLQRDGFILRDVDNNGQPQVVKVEVANQPIEVEVLP
jgi:tape measure domain-containing protein